VTSTVGSVSVSCQWTVSVIDTDHRH